MHCHVQFSQDNNLLAYTVWAAYVKGTCTHLWELMCLLSHTLSLHTHTHADSFQWLFYHSTRCRPADHSFSLARSLSLALDIEFLPAALMPHQFIKVCVCAPIPVRTEEYTRMSLSQCACVCVCVSPYKRRRVRSEKRLLWISRSYSLFIRWPCRLFLLPLGPVALVCRWRHLSEKKEQ